MTLSELIKLAYEDEEAGIVRDEFLVSGANAIRDGVNKMQSLLADGIEYGMEISDLDKMLNIVQKYTGHNDKKVKVKDKIRQANDRELAGMLCDLQRGSCESCPATQYCKLGHTGFIDYLERGVE